MAGSESDSGGPARYRAAAAGGISGAAGLIEARNVPVE